MKVLVTGSRSFENAAWLERELLALKPDVVVHGAARGADLIAEAVCKKHEIPYRGYPARWKVNGNSAGPIRNRTMLLIEHQPNDPIDVCLAFPVGIGAGTRGMMQLCVTAGIKVIDATAH